MKLAKTLGACAVAVSLFSAVQTYEYRELEARYMRDLERVEALSLENEKLLWELGTLKNQESQWTYNAFTGRLPDDAVQLALKEGHAQGVDPALVMAVIAQESGGKQDAKSKAGAKGLMQLMPDTAKWLKVDADCPKQNVRGGVSYLKRLLDKYGDVRLALMAYNWGPGNVDAWRETGKGTRGQAVPEETRRYVPGVLQRIQRVSL